MTVQVIPVLSAKRQPTVRFKMSEKAFQALDNDYCGLCVGCGETAYECEPDARGYQCEGCQAKRVYGIQELLLMSFIELIDEV